MTTKTLKLPKHWGIDCTEISNYRCGIDSDVSFQDKPVVLIESKTAGPEDYCRLFSLNKCGEWFGQRLRVSGYFKTDGVKGRAAISISGFTQTSLQLVYDSMLDRSLTGSNEWQRLETVFDLPEGAVFLQFGPTLYGTGQLWAADFKVEVVSRDVPRTDIHGSLHAPPTEPINLDFSARLDGSWTFVSYPNNDYSCEIIPSGHADKRALVIKSHEDHPPSYAMDDRDMAHALQTFSAVPYRGKKIRATAWVKAENCRDRCGILLFVQGTHSKWLEIATICEGYLTGTTDWQQLSRVLFVPEHAYSIRIDCQLNGSGTGYYSDWQIEVVGDDVPITQVGSAPENLDFSDF